MYLPGCTPRSAVPIRVCTKTHPRQFVLQENLWHYTDLNCKLFTNSKMTSEGEIANQCRTGKYATLSSSSNFSLPPMADTVYSESSHWCWWEDNSGLSCDRCLLMQWYSRKSRAPTMNAMVPVPTAIPTATSVVIVCIVPA